MPGGDCHQGKVLPLGAVFLCAFHHLGLDEIRNLGIQIAIDDFGTGYSWLSYLKNLPVNCLKIDKAFIDELSSNGGGPIVKTIIDKGRNMNYTVIAEGVETKDHGSFFRNNQCFAGQGLSIDELWLIRVTFLYIPSINDL
ncbi:EAL domain-containing protein [Neobacillus dielmonensis]|uniref:EAL domain-containing protein n=1 Tax=Neobacillus dielmonensis TaxID=1347369 RepID=UPI0005A94C76|nr:EAL domain-containing protein [Neobacillus dielmonensis]